MRGGVQGRPRGGGDIETENSTVQRAKRKHCNQTQPQVRRPKSGKTRVRGKERKPVSGPGAKPVRRKVCDAHLVCHDGQRGTVKSF